LELALRGKAATPLVAGLTFVAPELLPAIAPAHGTNARRIGEAAKALALDFVFVPAATPWAAELADTPRDFGVLWVVDGPLWPALLASGDAAEGLRATERDPASLRRTLDVEAERAAAQVARGVRYGVDGVVVADDLASAEGLLVSEGFALRELMPRLGGIVSKVPAPLPAFLHSDGDIRLLLPAIRAAGFHGIHAGGGLARDDFEELFWEARHLGLVVAGGIGTASLDRGAYAAVRAGTRAALLGQTGGLLIADDGGITTEDQVAAFASAVAAARGDVPGPRSG
jgi:hypothetical protein